MEELKAFLEESLNEGLYRITIGGPRKKDGASRLKVRPVKIKDKLMFQISRFEGTQVFHENCGQEETAERLLESMKSFQQMDVETETFKATVLASKKGKITVKKKMQAPGRVRNEEALTHDRAKRYILEEGRPVPFLQELGIQTPDGKIVKRGYDKFKQINRFLEFIEDILPILPKDRRLHIIDFGCGKSYLTFALYYDLHVLHGLDIEVTGLDLKSDVIEHCSALAVKYGYDGLHFLQGDIADYEGKGPVDMVVTLHACDTATDYALARAVKWHASVILSVPCCQHEINRQIRCDALQPALKYGIIKERMSALLTDAMRAGLLEEAGYDTQLLEFIDMEHTPKNILIRAVRGREGAKAAGVEEMAEFLHVHTTLQKLLEQNR